jgi:hypothetical protein
MKYEKNQKIGPFHLNSLNDLRTCSYIRTSINAVANNVMLQLYLLHCFYNMFLKSNLNYI